MSAWFIAPKTRLGFEDVAKARPGPGERVYSEIDVMCDDALAILCDDALAIREVAALGTPRTRVCLKNHYVAHPGTFDGRPLYSYVEVYPLPPGLAGLPVKGLPDGRDLG